jgi:hypothetical protein
MTNRDVNTIVHRSSFLHKWNNCVCAFSSWNMGLTLHVTFFFWSIIHWLLILTSNVFCISGCSIPQNQHLACGFTGISSSKCLVMGCCVDSATSACFYPMDGKYSFTGQDDVWLWIVRTDVYRSPSPECTADHQFIFAVHHNLTTFPVTPTKPVVAGKSSCGPVIVTDKFVVFKFSVTECGTRSYVSGQEYYGFWNPPGSCWSTQLLYCFDLN